MGNTKYSKRLNIFLSEAPFSTQTPTGYRRENFLTGHLRSPSESAFRKDTAFLKPNVSACLLAEILFDLVRTSELGSALGSVCWMRRKDVAF